MRWLKNILFFSSNFFTAFLFNPYPSLQSWESPWLRKCLRNRDYRDSLLRGRLSHVVLTKKGRLKGRFITRNEGCKLGQWSKVVGLALDFLIQWNLPKADTYGFKNIVRFREVSALQRFCSFWQKKNWKIVYSKAGNISTYSPFIPSS